MLLQFENEKTNRTVVTQMNRPTPEFSSLFAWASSPLRMVEPSAQVGIGNSNRSAEGIRGSGVLSIQNTMQSCTVMARLDSESEGESDMISYRVCGVQRCLLGIGAVRKPLLIRFLLQNNTGGVRTPFMNQRTRPCASCLTVRTAFISKSKTPVIDADLLCPAFHSDQRSP